MLLIEHTIPVALASVVRHVLSCFAGFACFWSSWVEAVFSLVWAVVSVQHGAAAMTECGLIPALLNVVQLNMDGQVWSPSRDIMGQVPSLIRGFILEMKLRQ